MSLLDIGPIIEQMLLVSENVSDLNFSVSQKPQVEINGVLYPTSPIGLGKLSTYQTETIAMSLIRDSPDAAHQLAKFRTADLSYALPGRCRFRVNIFQQRNSYSIVMRVIPHQIPSFDSLRLPKALEDIAEIRNGIVLLTGPTGSGKSSTLAAIIDRINEIKAYHIVTIEDPIEFLHNHKKSTINQREVGADTKDFASALRAALRQAPKVILVGEMRDLETAEIALEAAETGHLVLSTLHTIDASKTIDRIVGLYPKNEERIIRTRLAQTFRYIVSQRLIPKADGKGRVAAVEILKSNPRTREYIEKGETEGKTLLDAIRDGEIDGMQDFDSVIRGMIERSEISIEDGLSFATNQNNLLLQLRGLSSTEDFATQNQTGTSVKSALPPTPVENPGSVLSMIE
ncbi:MAG TPA: PilT/PilU family type 4a pilus ATPase [Pyrinomonadaceae bacterium]|nr:PilT/PilU family type 4a pilus ATPase [Chloracidobacterium sp.]MBP9934330.1 PilT/PilU family type 4a pilus ATPase [Pyrinomonadaceae bacterium]MBK7801475.1 PilT/PilU family type 4a pilus ATPase [Chloracidobacterium sp.]MBK9436793.1 PilT/PilU family type 4a pilus ATPase [Chloracidobacterium sp.]MBK9766438.1 PilT/PilU family type 4a pilus ATPase [Chloracidobacterium sp.]